MWLTRQLHSEGEMTASGLLDVISAALLRQPYLQVQNNGYGELKVVAPTEDRMSNAQAIFIVQVRTR